MAGASILPFRWERLHEYILGVPHWTNRWTLVDARGKAVYWDGRRLSDSGALVSAVVPPDGPGCFIGGIPDSALFSVRMLAPALPPFRREPK